PRVDVDEAVTESAMEKDRNGGDVVAAMRLLHDVMPAIIFVDVASLAGGDLVVDRARAGIAVDDELDAFGLHRAVLQGAHDLVAAGQHAELQLAGRALGRLLRAAFAISALAQRPPRGFLRRGFRLCRFARRLLGGFPLLRLLRHRSLASHDLSLRGIQARRKPPSNSIWGRSLLSRFRGDGNHPLRREAGAREGPNRDSDWEG